MGHDEGGGGGDEDGGKGAGRPSHISKGEVDLGRKRYTKKGVSSAFQSNVLTAIIAGGSHTRKPKVVASVHGAKASLPQLILIWQKIKQKQE